MTLVKQLHSFFLPLSDFEKVTFHSKTTYRVVFWWKRVELEESFVS